MPSLLLAEIHVFGDRPDFIIYTDKQSYGFLEHLPKMEMYESLDIKFSLIPEDIRDHYVAMGDFGGLKKVCQYSLLEWAWNEQRPFMWTYPDYIFGPKALRAIDAYARRGYRALLAAGICGQLESIAADPSVREAIYGFDGDPMRWGAIFLDHLHPFQRSKIWQSRTGEIGRSLWPSYLYCDDEKGMFLNILHPNPYYAYPRIKAPVSPGGFESDFVELAGIRPEEITVLDDGSFVMVEIADKDKPIHAPQVDPLLKKGLVPLWMPQVAPDYRGGPLPPLSDELIINWARIVTTPYQHTFFPRTIPLAIREGYSLDDCRDVMAGLSTRATRIAARI